MPKTYKLKVDNYSYLISSPKPQCIIACAHIKDFPYELPLTPNIREPNRKSSVYKQILDSLFVAPEKFVEKHSGITISVNKIKVINSQELELEILEYSEGYTHHGILNGGHSVLAFENAIRYDYKLKNAKVKVIIHVGLSEEEARDISLAANTNSPVDARSKINARGDYDFIKHYITQLERTEKKKFRIAYYQNQSSAPKDSHCSVNHIYKLLTCLDCNRYNPDNEKKRGKHPTSLSIPTEITDSEKERISRLLHLLPQSLWVEQRLYEIIYEYLSNPQRKGNNNLASIDTKKNTLLPDSQYSFGFGAPADLALPVVAAFRVFLDKEYKWVLPFEEFSENLLQHLWKKHFLDYLKEEKAAGNSVGAKISRNIEVWENLYTCASLYLNELYRKIINEKASDRNSKTKPKELILT
ncbi:AIPR family protein [Iningainema tapete]|uniref:AIPR family protein n=1 Tax=Iningainema tapete BLCC-T55 TaxID=2748662 RepID=A0A8J6XBH3_9CYAN|nr:AIPR family protein [Iningainema tapete]MBD2772145.1 AIPR family protein [Iningainema tapete BLCC-T55]